MREADLGRRTVDKLVRVWLKSGGDAWILIHVEVQSQEEASFEERMFVCNYRVYDRYGRVVVSLAVLGDDRLTWRPSRFGYELWGCGINFWFPTVKMLDYAADLPALEKSNNPFATVVLTHLKTKETNRDPEARRSWKIALVKGLYERGYSQEDVRKLLRFVAWMMHLPEKLEERFWKELHEYEEAKKMPYVTSLERLWLKQGEEKGRQEGRQEGLEQGARPGLLTGIEIALQAKFGADAQALFGEIESLPSVAALQAAIAAIRTSDSVDQLRQAIVEAKGLANGTP